MCDNRDVETLLHIWLAGWLAENFPKLPMYHNGRSSPIKHYEREEIFDHGSSRDKSLSVQEVAKLLHTILDYE